MSVFAFKKNPDVNRGVQEFLATPGAVLLDVRGEDEYRAGHIPGSRNLPLPMLPALYAGLGGADTPVFVYCLSGGRSAQAVRFLQRQGFTGVKNIGGIADYKGKVER